MHALKRELGTTGAVLLGLGAMLGTGIFVGIGVAAGHAGSWVVAAVLLAAAVAACNALSSAQLAASHPVSGGTYAYGYRYLQPWLGFTAGWMFLCAKTASAATAALGFAGYVLAWSGRDARALPWLAVTAVLALTALVLAGLRRSAWANTLIVGVTVLSLGALVIVGLPQVVDAGSVQWHDALPRDGLGGLATATALMFVAFTGYGRIATLGEEVRDPQRTIPRAILATVALATVLYLLVALVGIGVVGADALAQAAQGRGTPLAQVAQAIGRPWLVTLVSLGAITAMLGVLLNLILGLSRVVLAMARGGDLPRILAQVDAATGSPRAAVLAVGAGIALMAALGGIETAWSFSAFTVLIYYAITNLAALRMPASQRLYPRALAWIGLVACLGLAVWIPPATWGLGVGLLVAGWGVRQWLGGTEDTG